MQHKTTTAVGMVLATLSLGCTTPQEKSASAPTPAVTASDSATMADMPGMNMKGTVNTPADLANGSPAGNDALTKDAIAKELTLSSAQIQHGNVKWSAAVMSSAGQSALIPGVLLPNEDRTVRLGAPAAGRVLKVLVRSGDNVRVDQTLVTIQSPAAGMAQSEVTKAVAQVGAARSESQYAASARARAERLLALKAIPRQEYERAITDDEQARAGLAQAEAEAQRARTTADQLSAGAGANG
ncbi:MAG: efflux RND transporter periplasmic adaptor subunit, partial [Gemmatimonadaceae bacterium]